MSVSILDLLFPKRCVGCGKLGIYLCQKCYQKIEFVENPVCPVCQRQAIGGKTHPKCYSRFGLDGLVVATRYKGSVKAAVRKLKYRWVSDLGETLVGLIAKNLWKFSLPKDVVLVPVPLHARRKNWRGFNQAELLARILARQFKVPIADLLTRAVETKPQVTLGKEERKENIRGAFSVNKNVDVWGKDLVLVDDVYTSGVTMAEAAKVLKKSGAGSVWAMTVALG